MREIYPENTKLQIFVCFFFLLFYHRDIMQILARMTSAFLMMIVGFFAVSPSIALGAGQDEVFVMSGRVGDSCTVNIECRDVGESRIVCRSSGETIVPAGCTIRSIAWLQNLLPWWTPPIDWSYDELYIEYQNIVLLYEGPDTFVYPFVRITKIQV